IHRQGGPQHRGDPDPGARRVVARPQTRLRGPRQRDHHDIRATTRPAERRRGRRMIRVGQVMGAYGLDGAVKVMPLTDFKDRFDPGTSLLRYGSARNVAWSREGQPGIVVKLDGIDNRTMAELCRGRYLEAPDEEMRRREAGWSCHRQVVGLAAVTSSGQRLGVIAEVLERPANDVWVSREGSIEHLIPATRDAIVSVDLPAGQVVVADWLLNVEDAQDV